MQGLIEQFWAGDHRALAKVISIIENDEPDRDQLMGQIYSRLGQAHIIGVTGSPGAGKSTLVDCLISLLRKRGEKVGIVAIDPTSPFTGGALLGDRIRMQDHTLDNNVFIRSMGTRGCLGGLALTTREVVRAMDAFGFDWLIVETVGVGQAELDIMHVADSVIVVLTPGAGDAIQTLKAGIMEIADIFSVNKCDMAGADKIAKEVELMLNLRAEAMPYHPPVVKTSALSGIGLEDLLSTVEKHRTFLLEEGLFQKRREERLKAETLEIVERQWRNRVQKEMELSEKVDGILQSVVLGKKDPYTAGASILDCVINKGDANKQGDPNKPGDPKRKVSTGKQLMGALARLLYEKNGEKSLGEISSLFFQLGSVDGGKIKRKLNSDEFETCIRTIFEPATKSNPPAAEILDLSPQGVTIKGMFCPLGLKGAGRKLCEAAMAMDLGMIEALTGKEIEMQIDRTMAAGDQHCQVKFRVK